MAQLTVDAETLSVRLSRWERLGALNAGPVVPRSQVRSARISETPFQELRGLRAPGTGMPRVIALGTWRYEGRRDFAAVYRRKPAVVIELEGAPYERLIVSADNAAELARELS
jgi:hypothetical protein